MNDGRTDQYNRTTTQGIVYASVLIDFCQFIDRRPRFIDKHTRTRARPRQKLMNRHAQQTN